MQLLHCHMRTLTQVHAILMYRIFTCTYLYTYGIHVQCIMTGTGIISTKKIVKVPACVDSASHVMEWSDTYSIFLPVCCSVLATSSPQQSTSEPMKPLQSQQHFSQLRRAHSYTLMQCCYLSVHVHPTLTSDWSYFMLLHVHVYSACIYTTICTA